ncbi:MAG: hypothetical protein GY830_06170 [Bacteroidetes bacterium]|nr:hypothetical protein [Bacteroidota bacterium]
MIYKKLFQYIFILILLFQCYKNKNPNNKVILKNNKAGNKNRKSQNSKSVLSLKAKQRKIKEIKEQKLKDVETYKNKIKEINEIINDLETINKIILYLELEKFYPRKSKIYALTELLKRDYRFQKCFSKDIKVLYIFKRSSLIYGDKFNNEIKSKLQPLIGDKHEINQNYQLIKNIDKDLFKYDEKGQISKSFEDYNIFRFKENYIYNKSKKIFEVLLKVLNPKIKC